MAAKPTLLLYDEPTTGLDPMTSLTVDAEIIKLRDLENVTSVIVTHQLRDAFYIATHGAESNAGGDDRIVPADEDKINEADFVMIRDGRVVFEGSADDLRYSTDPYLKNVPLVTRTSSHASHAIARFRRTEDRPPHRLRTGDGGAADLRGGRRRRDSSGRCIR